mmetsp:Transcript_13195/g.14630  ORF Transcript_13195/g.14630 Transcript_13195/m.14630 type:complete len:146 (+) Transcript_13195:52-489(+)
MECPAGFTSLGTGRNVLEETLENPDTAIELQKLYDGCIAGIEDQLEIKNKTKHVTRWPEKQVLESTCLYRYRDWFLYTTRLRNHICGHSADHCEAFEKQFQSENRTNLGMLLNTYRIANDDEIKALGAHIGRVIDKGAIIVKDKL